MKQTDGVLQIDSAVLKFVDNPDNPMDIIYKIVAIDPLEAGSLQRLDVSWIDILVGGSFSQKKLDDVQMRFKLATNFSGKLWLNFTVGNSGAFEDNSNNTAIIYPPNALVNVSTPIFVQQVKQFGVSVNSTALTAQEGSAINITAASLSLYNNDFQWAELDIAFTRLPDPSQGKIMYLQNQWLTATLDTVVPATLLNTNGLKFMPTEFFNGKVDMRLKFIPNDSSQTFSRTVSLKLDIKSVNNEPQISNGKVLNGNGAAIFIGGSELDVKDPDNGPEDITVTISAPSKDYGIFQILNADWVDQPDGVQITYDRITSNSLRFLPKEGYTGDFSVTVKACDPESKCSNEAQIYFSIQRVGLAMWVIGVIIGSCALLVIGIVVFIRYARKGAKLNKENQNIMKEEKKGVELMTRILAQGMVNDDDLV